MSEFYQYKNNIYLVLGRVLMKCTATHVFIEAYKYTDGSGREYIREIRDFEAKFKRIANVILMSDKD